MATDLISGVLLLGLAFAAYSDRMDLTLLLSVQVLVALLYGFFDTATKGMLPQLVPQNELTRTNSALASARILSVMLSPVIGAALYARLGIFALILINGISFIISAGSSMLIKYRHSKRDSAMGVSGLLKDLSEGIRFIRNNKAIRALCGFSLVVFASIQPIFAVVLPLFFKTRLAYSDTQYGYLQMIIILGAMVGSILVGLMFSKDKEVTRPLVAGCALMMSTMLAFSALLAGVLRLLSISIMFINVPVQTYIQKATPDEYMSRVFSIVVMISKGGMPIGVLIYGFVLNRLEIHWTGLASALLMMIISVAFLVSLLKTDELK